MSQSNGSSRSVSKELSTETARRLRALEQSHQELHGQFKALSAQVNQMNKLTKNKQLSMTGTQAFLLRNQV